MNVGAESTATIEWSARLRRGSGRAVWINVQGDAGHEDRARHEGKAGVKGVKSLEYKTSANLVFKQWHPID